VFEDVARREEARVAYVLNNPQQQQVVASQQFAYFWVNGQYLYGDAQYLLYPADPATGRVLGPANGRVYMQNGGYLAVDFRGGSTWAQRVR